MQLNMFPCMKISFAKIWGHIFLTYQIEKINQMGEK
jgi:hypothetical protein